MFGWDDDRYRPSGPRFQSGGARPDVAPVEPQAVAFPSTFPVDSVVIDHKGRQLFFVTSSQEALRYPISVGREGFSWTGRRPSAVSRTGPTGTRPRRCATATRACQRR